jgi:hypothetical protein
VKSGSLSVVRSSARAAAIGSPAPIAMIISGTSALAPKNCARSRTPRTVPSTPSSTVAPATPWRCSVSTIARWAGRPPARSRRPT